MSMNDSSKNLDPGKQFQIIWDKIYTPRYTGRFTYSGFIQEHPQPFIVLGIFSAFVFYLWTYNERNILEINLFDLGGLITNINTSILIWLSFFSAIFVILVLLWVILSEAVQYNKKEVKPEKYNLFDEATSVIKRYSFITVLYILIFNSILYLIYHYVTEESLIINGIILVLGLLIQFFLIQIVYKKIRDEKDLESDVDTEDSKTQDRLINLTFLLIACLILITGMVYYESNVFKIFIIFPILLMFNLIYLSFSEFTTIIMESIRIGNKIIRQKPISYITTLTLFLILIALLVIIGFQAKGDSDQITGKWVNIDNVYAYEIFENHTFSISYNGSGSYGCWANINDTCYKFTYDNKINELENKILFIYDVKCSILYSLNDTGFWIKKI